MDDSPILGRIDALVEEEHRLWAELGQGRIDRARHNRLEAIREELGPEPEPPHLEHGIHTDQPAPDPDVPRNIP